MILFTLHKVPRAQKQQFCFIIEESKSQTLEIAHLNFHNCYIATPQLDPGSSNSEIGDNRAFELVHLTVAVIIFHWPKYKRKSFQNQNKPSSISKYIPTFNSRDLITLTELVKIGLCIIIKNFEGLSCIIQWAGIPMTNIHGKNTQRDMKEEEH